MAHAGDERAGCTQFAAFYKVVYTIYSIDIIKLTVGLTIQSGYRSSVEGHIFPYEFFRWIMVAEN